ncbi:MAG: hypothetical protein ABH871_10355 [Pseudomonadota bacterium]
MKTKHVLFSIALAFAALVIFHNGASAQWNIAVQPEIRTDNYMLNLTGQTNKWEIYGFLTTDLFEAEAGPRFRIRNLGLLADSLDFTFRGGVVWLPEDEIVDFQTYVSGILRIGRVTLVVDNEFKIANQHNFVPAWAYNEGHLIYALGQDRKWQVGGFYERFHNPIQTMWVVGPRVSRTWPDFWLSEAVFEIGLTDSQFVGLLLTFAKPTH